MLPMFIDGTRTHGAADQAIDVMNPATEEIMAQVPAGGEHEVGLAVAAARSFPEEALGRVLPGQACPLGHGRGA